MGTISSETLYYVLNHVFFPPKLPQEADTQPNPGDIAICQLAYDAAVRFPRYLSEHQHTQWAAVTKMLKNLLDTVKLFDKEDHVRKILDLANGEALVFHIRAQNAGLILLKSSQNIVFEAFEASPPPEEVMGAEGKLICSYPGPAINVPLSTAQDRAFVEQLVSFLSQMDTDELDTLPTTTKAGSKVEETRGTRDPRYITQLLIAILHGMGEEANVERITKRIADEVCWNSARNPWRRSPLWLVLRVAVQRVSKSRETYKEWMLFFHTQLLQLFLDNNFSSDLLYTARVKASRRAYKIGASAPPLLLQAVKNVGQAIEVQLQARWSDEQRLQASSPLYCSDPSTIEKDTTLSLLSSRAYLTNVLRPESFSEPPTIFRPDHQPRIRDWDISTIYPDGLAKAVKADPYVALADFEFLVQEHLDLWTSKNLKSPSASEILNACLEQYISAAKVHYGSNPEDQSIMLLTILDLWVALDTVVCSQYPLLCSYSPEIPATILEPLLIRCSKFLDRAAAIERYLRRRHSSADRHSTPIYSANITCNTFAVRYFEQSASLNALKSSIERAASDERHLKRTELQRLNAKHAQLMHRIAALACTYESYTDRYGFSRSSHYEWSCGRCALEREANSMHIDVHEWPLPTGLLEARATVFELNCPPGFMIWRTLTYQILRDIGMAHVDSKPVSACHLLGEYSGLQAWLPKGDVLGRITFASETKSFLESHYRNAKIPATEDSVCVNNGLHFVLYDRENREPAYPSFDPNIDSYCTLSLPKKGSSYQHLQYAVAHTTHAHNSTIVKQSDCPIDLSIHEQLAFSNLRCGPQLQWMNVVRELRTRTLTFSRDEVHTLFMQAAWQIGALASDGHLRIWHTELTKPDFSSTLIQEASELLSHVERNWMEGNTVKTIIYLISRLLTSATDSEVFRKGYELLRKGRKITHQWMHQIMSKLEGIGSDNEDIIGGLQRRACEMAAICRATFDVDAGAHLNVLLASAADVAILVECSIVIHDNTPHYSGDSFPDFQRLLHRNRRLSHFLELSLARHIHTDIRGLNTAIGSLWPTYRPGNEGWKRLPEPNSRWVTSFTDPLPNQRTQQVHYNLLTGKLLIDGKPLGRLPREILGHSIYRRIFGQKFFDIIPANMKGMDYATRLLVHGFQIFFGFHQHNTQGLIIRAQSHSGQIFELIPHNVLVKDFPYFLTADYVHWMDIATGKIEFRPLDQLWQQSPQNWHLNFSLNGPSTMFHGETQIQRLIDIRSTTYQGIAARLFPLEHSDYLIIILDMDFRSLRISIDLPRFGLSFFLNDEDELESNNMQNMVIDHNQCTGTMIGLRSQLVLRHKDLNFASLPRSRSVIIPHGKVISSISPNGNHVHVTIDTLAEFKRQVIWYKYDIDSDLGVLVGNISLRSRLFRIYLHALCSHPLPDPLTGQMSTNYALQELGNAGCFSFQQLAEVDIELLRLIGKISPNRCYYPNHLRVMQTVSWSPHLPVLSQHRLFDTAVSKIMDHAQSLAIFPELSQAPTYQSGSHSILVARAGRCAIYYQGDIDSSSDSDRCYYSRDYTHNTSAEVEAFKTSRLVNSWPIGLTADRSMFSGLLEIFEKWGVMQGLDPRRSLIYSKDWLLFDLSKQWLSIYECCRQIEHPHLKFTIIFSFAALSYRNQPDLQKHIAILLACATIRRSLLDAPPYHPIYELSDGFEPLQERVSREISSNIYSLDDSPVANLGRLPHDTYQSFRSRLQSRYEDISQRKINDAVGHLMDQWPCSNPRSPFYETDSNDWFPTNKIMKNIEKYFASCFSNRELRTFASRVSRVLQEHYTASPLEGNTLPKLEFSPQYNVTRVLKPSHTLQLLLSSHAVPSLQCASHKFGEVAANARAPRNLGQLADITALANLIDRFERNHTSALHQMYRDRLKESQNELFGQRTPILPKECTPPIDICIEYRKMCQHRLSDIFTSIFRALVPLTPAEEILRDAGLWPSISRCSVLQPLASSTRIHPLGEWSEVLIAFAEAFIEYQHSQRLVGFSLRSEVNNFFKELDNASFNWADARRNPVWLTIQIQGNFITRPLQSQVAAEMIAPSSEQSSVLQLNMGEGKSHVIVPLVAAALADSQKLVRVVVLKPLAKQMFQLLIERMTGLPNRRIFYLPFSRDVQANPQTIQNIRNLFEECARVSGVLVAQPEHILSFRLMVVDQIISSEGHGLSQVARDLQATQDWLNSVCRDILDESDELLHVRYQLIYTMDQQQPLDGCPDRWIITQRIFDLVCEHMKMLHKEFPEEVELIEHNTGTADEAHFPYFRLLGASASKALVSRIAEDALNGRVENLTFVGLGFEPALRSSVLRFITIHDVNAQSFRRVKDVYETTSLWKGLLLLRGLLAHGILVYTLSSRRWRVDYGLDPRRSLLAVPYRAKDVPSLRSEFGHPDIVVCLTCLTYYYGGLTTNQVNDCFELVWKLDNPSLEYESWVQRGGEGIPSAIRQIIGVNMKDVDTFTTDVIPVFQHNKGAIDFYLSHVVFPKEAKEFPFKLGTSGWDLAETKANFITGFSGTNDNSDLLPTSITQSDPVNQLRTNAQVLEYILRPENNRYLCSEGQNGQSCSAAELLKILVSEPKEIRVLLDVGAQMLEMTNQQLVEHWLSLTSAHDVAAGIFFDDSDSLSVLTRDGTVEPLHSSPFLQRLYQCIIYLDDAHTRGTDLKLPPDFRAMVTLGPKITKDKLVQGCMRMRNLGHGQSVVFCAPPEIDRHIRGLGNISSSAPVQVIDVLCWAMSNTCTDIKDHIPHWVQQGVYYHNRQAGYSAFSTSEEKSIEPLKTTWLETAARELDEMYGVDSKDSFNMELVKKIPAMHDRLRMLGVTQVRDGSMTEEQEREVSHELEEEPQLERPPEVPAAVHKLDREVQTFVQHGILSGNSTVFLPLMTPLYSGSHKLRVSPQNSWAKYLLGTRDFMTTTARGKERSDLTEYLRPVNWIVSHIRPDGVLILVVMSPYEVNILLEDIRKSKHVRLHIYAPRTSESMKSFDDLAFYCIPPLGHDNRATLFNNIGSQLNVWAGQLYFDSYETYLRVCLLLGLSSSESAADHQAVESDRFVPTSERTKEMAAVGLFDESPVVLLQRLLGLRRKGMSFQSTHMGKILQARLLLPEDFEK